MKIAIAEDNANLRKSLVDRLSSFQNVELVAVAVNGIDLLKQLENCDAELVLMDINMPGLNGIETTQRLRQAKPHVKVLMLTVFDEDDKIFQSILAGASGYMLKDERAQRIVEAAEDCLAGGAPMSASIASKTLNLLRGRYQQQQVEAAEFGLSERELEILQKTASGLTNAQIGEELFISPKTVRKHIENIYQKLQVHNRVEALNVATKHKLLSLLF